MLMSNCSSNTLSDVSASGTFFAMPAFTKQNSDFAEFVGNVRVELVQVCELRNVRLERQHSVVNPSHSVRSKQENPS